MNDNSSIDEGIYVPRFPGWPMVLQQSLIFSELSDDEFRIACAYLVRDEHNSDRFDDFVTRYDSKLVADVVKWVRDSGYTRNG